MLNYPLRLSNPSVSPPYNNNKKQVLFLDKQFMSKHRMGVSTRLLFRKDLVLVRRLRLNLQMILHRHPRQQQTTMRQLHNILKQPQLQVLITIDKETIMMMDSRLDSIIQILFLRQFHHQLQQQRQQHQLVEDNPI